MVQTTIRAKNQFKELIGKNDNYCYLIRDYVFLHYGSELTFIILEIYYATLTWSRKGYCFVAFKILRNEKQRTTIPKI